MVQITFLGAAGTVTGSKYLVEGGGKKILVDAGLFQGDRVWREKNWAEPQFDPEEIDAVLLTHAHVDHVGMLPRFKRLGLSCPVYSSAATQQLSQLILLDSAHLQEEEAEFRQKHHASRHNPPLPLYGRADAEAALSLYRSVRCNEAVSIAPGIKATWSRMGHIIGACSIRLEIDGRVINFSGDIGRYNVPILRDPVAVEFGDLLLIESTYGTTIHTEVDPSEQLARVVNETAARKGALLIPSFAVGRTQTLLFYLRQLKEQQRIPDIPIFVDSPMARDATSIYAANPDDYDEQTLGVLKESKRPFAVSRLRFTQSRQDSISLNQMQGPLIIISASGMMTGGRILHHLRHRISDPRNTLLFVGFQPPGSRGAWIKARNGTVRIFAEEYPIRAAVEEISSFSAHADREELLRWCRSCHGVPSRVAVVHGEPAVAKKFCETLQAELRYNAFVAEYLQKIEV